MDISKVAQCSDKTGHKPDQNGPYIAISQITEKRPLVLTAADDEEAKVWADELRS